MSRGSSTIASYTYNPAGQRASFGGGYGTSYGYDPVGRLTSQSILPASTNHQVQYGFSYNPSSQIIRETRDNGLYAWAGANVNESYGTANGLNQYQAVGGQSMTYDANGNLIYDGTTNTTYCYDIENRLISNNASCTPTLAYDPLGRLYEIASGGNTTKLIYDGDALVMETNASGTIQRRYVHGIDAGDDPIAWYEGPGFTDSNERLLRPNHQGSIVTVADHATSTIYAVNTYDEYGVPGPSNLGRFQYTGQQWIAELGLYHYKARAYSPKLGRFLQMDPIGYKDDINLYVYVGGDPVNGVDPTGMFLWPWENAVTIKGGTEAQRKHYVEVTNRVLGTDHGQQMLSKIEGPWYAHGRPQTIELKPGIASQTGALSVRGSNGKLTSTNRIQIDPNYHPAIKTEDGPTRISDERVVAHELGHSVMGAHDDGDGAMNNVNQNENPVAKELGLSRRTEYKPVDGNPPQESIKSCTGSRVGFGCD